MRIVGPPLRLRPTAALAAVLLAACGGSPDPAPSCDAPPVVTLGATETFRYVGAAQWPAACGSLTVRAPALAGTERLGLVLVNAGGPDNAAPTISLAGTAAFAAAEATPLAATAAAPSAALAAAPGDRAALRAGQALVVERRRTAMADWLAGSWAKPGATGAERTLATAACPPPPPPPTAGSKRSFCKDKLTGARRIPVRRDATLVHATDHALFYVADEVLPQVQALLAQRPSMWQDFGDAYEGTNTGGHNAALAKRIRPSLHDSFGVETDFDCSGRVVFLFANLLEYLPAAGSGVIVGYFDPTDQQAADPFCTTPAATTAGTGSNGADMLFLLDPATFISRGYPAATVLDQELPGTMAHELQHDIIFNARCRLSSLPSCPILDDHDGDLWLNEGLSMVSEDYAGFGLNVASERARVGTYLDCVRTGSNLCYQAVSLTTWPADEPGNPTGHYGGAHAFLRWHADQADAGNAAAPSGSALTRALVGSASASRAALAAASGFSFEEGFARFGAGALFSGEDPLFAAYPGPLRPAPHLSFAAGTAWSPLHVEVGPVKYTRLQPGAAPPTTLRNDGWGAYLSGRGTGGEATLTIGSSATVKPQVAVVRFKGDLPP
jgi:hypothetical protein